METAAAGILLAALVLLLVLPSVVEISFELGADGWHGGIRALGGLVRRSVIVSGKGPAQTARRRSVREWRTRLAAVHRFLGPGLYLLHKTSLGRLDVDLEVGLEQADLTAWSVGGLWAVTGALSALVGRLVAPGSVRPRVRVAPCFGRAHWALAVRGRARVRVWDLLGALWRALPYWWEMRMPLERLHKFHVPEHIKVRRKKNGMKKTR